jgi:cytosine/adenosine deaminase-related metal-dependent hydrolase
MIHLKNAIYIDWQTLDFTQTDIWVEQGMQGNIHFSEPANLPEKTESIDCRGMFVTRSLINAHHHIYSALARGMPQPAKEPENFHQKLQYVWWKLDHALDEEMIRSSALVTALYAAKSGCSFIIDHHSSPAHIGGSLDIIAEALDEAGLGHVLAYEISDRDGADVTQQALTETENYLKKRQGLVGLHAGFTVSDETLLRAKEIALENNTGVHIHLAEDHIDQEISLKNYGKRVVQRFADLGVLDLKASIFVHAIHLDASERQLLNENSNYITVNYDSNLNNKVGIFNGSGLGENIMLGTDGMHSDMFASARTAWFTGMNHENLSPMTVYSRLRKAHDYLCDNKFAGDGENNLMIFDYDTPTPFNQDNFLGHFFYGLNSGHVRHLISKGKLIMKDRQHTMLDEEKILAESRIQARKLWEKLR